MSKQVSKNWEKEVAKLAAHEIARDVLAMDVSDVEIPENLKNRINNFFAEEREKKASRTRAVRRRVAVILIAALLATLTACASIRVIREKIYEIVIEYYEKYFSYKSESQTSGNEIETEAEAGEFIKRIPSYLPDGYELYMDNSSDDMTKIYYWDPTSAFVIVYEQFPIGMLGRDGNVEKTEITSVKIKGYDGIATVKTTENGYEITLIWNDGRYDYSLVSVLTLEETILIAESIE